MTDPERIRALAAAKLDVELALWELKRRQERLTEVLDAVEREGDTEAPTAPDYPVNISDC